MSSKTEDVQKEFEDFVYIVSHDLNGPIRHVREFSRMLIEAKDRGDDEAANQYAEFINRSTDKMDNMLQAILAFSRINTRPTPTEKVDVKSMVKRVLDTLEAKYPHIHDEIDIGELFDIEADPLQVQKLFYSVLDNAMKFTAGSEPRMVKLYASHDGEVVTFTVEDNGIGINPSSYEEVFKIFRKLHAPEKYEGVGAGLTLAQKIVTRHKGEIWIHPDMDVGTAISFTLPIKSLIEDRED